MGCREDVPALGLGNRKSQRVMDRATVNLVVARETGEDREARRVGRRPPEWAELVRTEVPVRPGCRVPTAAVPVRVVELEEMARRLLHDEHMPVTGARRATFYRRV